MIAEGKYLEFNFNYVDLRTCWYFKCRWLQYVFVNVAERSKWEGRVEFRD